VETSKLLQYFTKKKTTLRHKTTKTSADNTISTTFTEKLF